MKFAIKNLLDHLGLSTRMPPKPPKHHRQPAPTPSVAKVKLGAGFGGMSRRHVTRQPVRSTVDIILCRACQYQLKWPKHDKNRMDIFRIAGIQNILFYTSIEILTILNVSHRFRRSRPKAPLLKKCLKHHSSFVHQNAWLIFTSESRRSGGLNESK